LIWVNDTDGRELLWWNKVIVGGRSWRIRQINIHKGGPEMTTLNYGNGNHTKAALTVDGDVIIFGNGQGDTLSLTGSDNTVTFGKGNSDAATLTDSHNTATFGEGNNDAVTLTGSFNTAMLGNGNNDTATVSGGVSNRVTLGDGNNDTVTVNDIGQQVLTLGDGNNDTVIVSDAFANVTLGKGHGDSVTVNNGGVTAFLSHPGDTISLTNSFLNLDGADEMVFLGTGNNFVALSDNSTGTQLNIGPTTGNDHFAPNFLVDLQTSVIDLKGGIGGFTSVTGPGGVLNALQDDGFSGGTLLSFGSGSSLDIVNFAPDQLTAANFKIG
jgi:hypothetical protein